MDTCFFCGRKLIKNAISCPGCAQKVIPRNEVGKPTVYVRDDRIFQNLGLDIEDTKDGWDGINVYLFGFFAYANDVDRIEYCGSIAKQRGKLEPIDYADLENIFSQVGPGIIWASEQHEGQGVDRIKIFELEILLGWRYIGEAYSIHSLKDVGVPQRDDFVGRGDKYYLAENYVREKFNPNNSRFFDWAALDCLRCQIIGRQFGPAEDMDERDYYDAIFWDPIIDCPSCDGGGTISVELCEDGVIRVR